MVVTIHQPDFLPWLGFFDRWQKSDLYIILDDVQFLRCGWHHRDKIKTKDGIKWLTVPVLKKGKYLQLIKDVKIDNSVNWRSKHLRMIELNYKKTANFEHCFQKIKEAYNKKYSFLIDLNTEFLYWVSRELQITTPVIFASDFNVKSAATQRLADLTKNAGGTAYLTGLGSKKYLEEPLFKKDNIKILWQEFQHPAYRQLHGEFVSNLSVLDYLMNESKPYCMLISGKYAKSKI